MSWLCYIIHVITRVICISFFIALQYNVAFSQSPLPNCPDQSKLWDNCYGTLTWNNGLVYYKGEWKDNKKHGRGVYSIFNKSEYEGEWDNDARDGIGNIEYENGDYYRGEWRNNKRHGFGELRKIIDDNSFFEYVGEFRNDKANGVGILRYKAGTPESYTDGDTWVGFFKNGTLNGIGAIFKTENSFLQGNIVKQGIFENHKLVEEKDVFEKNKIGSKCNFIAGEEIADISNFRDEAKLGNLESQYCYAQHLIRNSYAKDGKYWLEKSAKAGYVPAKLYILLESTAMFNFFNDNTTEYLRSLVEYKSPEGKFNSVSFSLLPMLASLCYQRNIGEGCYQLGLAYENGSVITQDYKEAERRYSEAVSLGHKDAKTKLALLQERHKSVDKSDIFELFLEASKQGDYLASAKVAEYYEEGKGVGTDLEKAIFFYKLSIEQGNAESGIRLRVFDLERTLETRSDRKLIPVADDREKWALVIGNSKYVNAITLRNPHNDAKKISEVLRKIGFNTIEGYDLARANMQELIFKFAKESSNADISLFFYAGHAIQVDGKNLLIPVDAELNSRAAIDFELVSMDLITKYLGGRQRDDVDSVGLVFLDACRDNPFAKKMARSLSRSASQMGRGLANIGSMNDSMLVAFAAAPGEVAQDGEGANSPFTTALLKHIATPGLEIELAMKRIKSEVRALTGGEQQPWHNTDLTREVYLVPVERK